MGAVVGLAVGIGFPVFMISRDKADEERVDALRELNKQTFEATGEYLSKVIIANRRFFEFGLGRINENENTSMDRSKRIQGR